MTNPFVHFPPEVVANVISYISQDDCIECLRVCRRWNHIIPVLSKQLWRQLIISKPSTNVRHGVNVSWGTKTNDCLMKCLPYVREISIKGFAPYLILKTLASLSCTVTFLEIDMHPYHIANNGTRFLLDAVSPFKNTLTELVIDQFPHDIALKALLKRLPNLTHLTFRFPYNYGISAGKDYYDKFGYVLENGDDSSYALSTNLVYLNMEIPPCGFQQGLDIILSSCPKLRALIVPNVFEYSDKMVISCDLLDSQFPLLRYLSWGATMQVSNTIQQTVLNRWMTASTNAEFDMEVGTLREVVFTNYRCYENDAVTSLIKRSQQQLSVLHLRPNQRINIEQTQELIRLQYPQLKHLVLDLYAYDPAEIWNNFVKTCGQLESLGVIRVAEYTSLYTIVESIRIPEYLRKLQLHGHRGCQSHGKSIGRILQRFSALQHLDLFGICVRDHDLLDIFKLQSLETLILEMDYHEDQMSLEGLLEAVHELRANESGIQRLELIRVQNLTDMVLERLGQVKSLLNLSVQGNKHITEKGVSTFLDVYQSGSRSLHVKNCPKIFDGAEWTFRSRS